MGHLRELAGLTIARKERLHGTMDRMSRVREGPARGIHWSEPNITVPRVKNFSFWKRGDLCVDPVGPA